MASPQYQSGNGVRYTQIYQDATSLPSETAVATFNLSNPVPAGMAEMIGFRINGTAAAQLSQATASELITGLRFTLNGDQLINIQIQGAVNTNADCSRFSALLQDIGGFVVESPASATAFDMTVWIPLGVNVPVNSRFELALDYAVAAAAITTGNFATWIKYGKSTNMTVIGNQTSQTIADAAQTMVSVKIPTLKGATVAGIAIQGSRNSDNMTAVIPKVLGDFALSPTQLRGASGASQNGYMYADAGEDQDRLQYSDGVAGYYFCPLYNASVSDGSVVLLITSTNDDGSGSEFYTFTPIMNLATSTNSGERVARQTSKVATGSKGAILTRAEDQ